MQWPDGEHRLTLPFPGYGVTLQRNNLMWLIRVAVRL